MKTCCGGAESFQLVSSSLCAVGEQDDIPTGAELKRDEQCFCFPQLWVLESTTAREQSPEAESLSPLGYAALCLCLDPCASQIIHLTLLFSLQMHTSV